MDADPKKGKKPKKKRGLPYDKLKKVYGEVIERDRFCQSPFCEAGWPLDNPHHIVKRSAGGKDVVNNLVLTCLTCHRLIHDEWINVEGTAPDKLVWIDKR